MLEGEIKKMEYLGEEYEDLNLEITLHPGEETPMHSDNNKRIICNKE